MPESIISLALAERICLSQMQLYPLLQVGHQSLYQCQRCRHQSSLTSGTNFDSSKLPLTFWFLTIYLITQLKNGLSSLNLSRMLVISANIALRLKHKLQQVMKGLDDKLLFSGIVQIDDAYWGGKKHDGKRGRGATGETPFLAEYCFRFNRRYHLG